MNFKPILTLILFVCLMLVFVEKVNAATLGFSPDVVKTTVGQDSQVDINLNPSGVNIIGADLIINYDPASVELIDIVPLGAFSDSTGKSINNDVGWMSFAVFNKPGIYLTAEANIARINFRTKKPSTTDLRFDFEKLSTNDTNVAGDGGRDLLSETKTLKIISSASNSSVSNNSEQTNSNTPDEVLGQTSEVEESTHIAAESYSENTNEENSYINNNSEESTFGISDDSDPFPSIINESSNESSSNWIFHFLLILIGLISGSFATLMLSKHLRKN